MLTKLRAATAQVSVEPFAFGGGLDMISPPGYSAIGSVRFGTNYELEFGGGYRRVGGFERYSGQPSPSVAQYVLLESAINFTGVIVGNTVVGATSGATGVVAYVSGPQICLTKVLGGPFAASEVLTVSTVPIGTTIASAPEINGFFDNELAYAAAEVYRADIAKPPGAGPIRGVAVLNNLLYCWREVAGALVTYKASVSGWVVVPLQSQIRFNGGSAIYVDGSTLTQGGASATIKRVLTESGDWTAGTAAGRFVIEPIAGTFIAGAAAGGGACNLLGAASAITMFSGGRVQSVVYNFTAAIANRRLYCCDGVNLEWEFDGVTTAPLATGMAGIRATAVAAHKNHLFYAYRSSLQHSAIANPYNWTPLLGAGELGTGDTITNLIGVSGSEASAALMAQCQDSAWVLYGSDSASWQFVRISEEAGAQAGSAQEINGVLSFDRDGFRRFKPTLVFGNFSYESESRLIEPLVKNATVKASVLVKNKSQYRCFFSDGLFLSGTPIKGGTGWMACDYGRVIECAVGAEINGRYRIFMGDADGWVLEADVGRNFDGATVLASMRLSSQNQRSSVTIKQYRHLEMESLAESAFELAVAAEYSDSDPDLAAVTATSMQDYKRQYGSGLFWDFNSWDRAYWDVSLTSRVRYPIHGQGRSIALLMQSESANQLPHTVKSGVVLHTVRRIAR